MIRVLIVEDSDVVREFLGFMLSTDPEICVVGTARDGKEAVDAVKRLRPDVVTMDVNMPRLNGFDATRQIMEDNPVPIVIVTASWDPKEVETTFRALEAGALTAILRPKGIGHPEHETTAKGLVQTVKLMSEVKVVRRLSSFQRKPAVPPVTPPSRQVALDTMIVAIGTSTGGPIALRTVLSGLPRDLPVPVLIVQHMASGFIQGFVEWLSQASGFPVHVATDKERPLPGHAYVAPDGLQMGVDSLNRIVLSGDEPENGLRPSASYLFRSVADVYGRSAIGVLLTGMGTDGAKELKSMKDGGALTIAQDKESSVVHGMPGEAINLGAATYVLPPDSIAEMLIASMKRR